ncbi:hypothetical protein GCM10022403_022550 [Streptomyces coacervatus]|uniref:Transposase n=1 Tax=Streptomyces coacervatus TaxID=647381 RepID=A0ABP7HAM3_9ACTN
MSVKRGDEIVDGNMLTLLSSAGITNRVRNRRTRIQKIYWRADGTPDFGIPVADGAVTHQVRFRACGER